MVDSIKIIWHYLPALMQALPTTLQLLVVSVIVANIFGLILAWARVGKNKIAKAVSGLYISFIRGTPMMVQILLVFIWIPVAAYNHGINTGSWNPILYALIAYSLNLSAFFAEIFRSAYIAIDYRQIEAAQSLGMNKIQVFNRVILPQGAASAFPNLTNMSLEQMKNTSIAAVIGVYDILGKAQQLAKNNYGVGQMELYITVGVIFWLIGMIILYFSRKITKRLNVGMA
ncbi:MAG: amino acid ABC transporter permease [Eubacterium sp.]|nr:amino acid ABC transporter permease [Eubacterium sp.]